MNGWQQVRLKASGSSMSGIYLNFLPRHAELQGKHELKMGSLREELELRRKTEIHEIEEVGQENSHPHVVIADLEALCLSPTVAVA